MECTSSKITSIQDTIFPFMQLKIICKYLEIPLFERKKLKFDELHVRSVKSKTDRNYSFITNYLRKTRKAPINWELYLTLKYEFNFWYRGRLKIKNYISFEFSNGDIHFWAPDMTWHDIAVPKEYQLWMIPHRVTYF